MQSMPDCLPTVAQPAVGGYCIHRHLPESSGYVRCKSDSDEVFEVVDTKMNWLFFKDQCRHCDDPPCTECPLKAIIKQGDGVVRIDSTKCFPDRCSSNAVKPCQEKCEFDEIPRYRYMKDRYLRHNKNEKVRLLLRQIGRRQPQLFEKTCL